MSWYGASKQKHPVNWLIRTEVNFVAQVEQLQLATLYSTNAKDVDQAWAVNSNGLSQQNRNHLNSPYGKASSTISTT